MTRNAPTMVPGGPTDGGAALADVRVDAHPDLGLVVIVDGVPHRVDSQRLRLLGRQALAHANAWEGVPPEPEPVVMVEPFAPIRPGRLPVEAGIPDDLWSNPSLTVVARVLWTTMWRLAAHMTGRPRWRGRLISLSKPIGRSRSVLIDALRELERTGWVTVTRRAERPSGYGELEVDLHLARRPDATAAGVIETTAEPKPER
jgi:hypothetical protein